MYRYIGNKTAVLSPLLEIITANIESRSIFVDPMCGTASVAAAIAELGHSVRAGDILTFPTYHAHARLVLNSAPNFEKLGCSYGEIIEKLNSLSPVSDYFSREFAENGIPANGAKPRKYFTGENASKIDAISNQISEWRNLELIDESQNMLLRHDLIMAVNRVANIAGTYGHYRASFSTSSRKPIELRASTFNEWASSTNSVFNGPVERTVPIQSGSILYLDPPYMKRQYAANYHLLETVALGDKPTPIGESGLRDWWPQYSDFCSKRKIADAFRATLSDCKFSKVFVSYSQDGLIPLERMSEILSEFGSVKSHSFTHKRFRSNNSPLEKILLEYVFEVSVA